MRIGLYIRLFGRQDREPTAPSWASIRAHALAAEASGFDLVVFEDALMYPDETGNLGVWESVSIVAAAAAATERIGVGHAVLNSPYRPPALTAKIAATLDEIAGGRYIFGIGLGNTPDDYPLFGIDADPRYSRFAEAIAIIHALLKDGRSDFDGRFYRAPGAELILHGPRPTGPPIIIAAAGPKALRLVARYADGWNWWVADRGATDRLPETIAELERACAEVDRDPRTLTRSLDVFSVAAPGVPDADPDGTEVHISGSPETVAEALLEYRKLGFDEVRVNLRAGDTPRLEAIAWMRSVVELVHRA